MNIKLNGSPYNAVENSTLKDIILSLNIKQENIVAEVNGEIFTEKMFADKVIYENDVIELVRFVGGG